MEQHSVASKPRVDSDGNALKPESREAFLLRFMETCYRRGDDYYISKMAIKMNGYDVLMVVTRTEFETRQNEVAFVGARDLKQALEKFYGAFGSGELKWREDRYAKENT